jgi:glycerol-3-phosphate acyltransferase PlsX
VGDGRQIEQHINELGPVDRDRLAVTHTSATLAADAGARDALRGEQASSLHTCLQLLAEQRVGGVVSAGSTAALVALGRRRVSMLPGFSRPALCTALPVESGLSYLLDLGASVDTDSQALYEFGLLGSGLVRALHDCPTPRVVLLSNGSEAGKGNTAMREAAHRLEADPQVNYCGYIEGCDLYSGAAELIVCDGLLGNVALKTAEGTAAYAARRIGESFGRHWWLRLLAVAAAPALRELAHSLSADRHGGAFMLGLNGVVVKSHGGSNCEGFCAAIEQAARCIEQDMVPGLARYLDTQEIEKE